MSERPSLMQRFALRRLINASGTETSLGASRVDPEVISDMAEILRESVEMSALQAAASRAIAEATGAEAGFVTNCSAAGLTIAAAAAMTGTDMARIERLPDTGGLKDRVILQKGHEVNFGSTISQMIRLSGARVAEVGTATDCSLYQLEAELGSETAAAFFVVSHHTVQSGLVDLASFAATCRARGVPVIVDAAAEYGWREFLAAGADLLLVSAQKAAAGPTAGIIAGRLDLVRACRMQERGIGRPMKAGKEAVAGAIAALRRWQARLENEARTVEGKLAEAEHVLAGIPGLALRRERDPTGNPFERLALDIDTARAGWSAAAIARALAAGEPSIRLRDLERDRGRLLLDVRRLDDETLPLVLDAIRKAFARPLDETAPAELPGDDALKSFLRWPE